MIIAIDFDGTIVSHKFPEIGEDNGAIPVLKSLIDNGHKLILHTMRGEKPYEGRNLLAEAVEYLEKNDITLWGVNENPEQKSWTDSPKIYANLYIDDAAVGCPKKLNDKGEIIVDWNTIDNWFKISGIINTVIQ